MACDDSNNERTLRLLAESAPEASGSLVEWIQIQDGTNDDDSHVTVTITVPTPLGGESTDGGSANADSEPPRDSEARSGGFWRRLFRGVAGAAWRGNRAARPALLRGEDQSHVGGSEICGDGIPLVFGGSAATGGRVSVRVNTDFDQSSALLRNDSSSSRNSKNSSRRSSSSSSSESLSSDSESESDEEGSMVTVALETEVTYSKKHQAKAAEESPSFKPLDSVDPFDSNTKIPAALAARPAHPAALHGALTRSRLFFRDERVRDSCDFSFVSSQKRLFSHFLPSLSLTYRFSSCNSHPFSTAPLHSAPCPSAAAACNSISALYHLPSPFPNTLLPLHLCSPVLDLRLQSLWQAVVALRQSGPALVIVSLVTASGSGKLR
ncbi:unnamed protein product [Closterium sp. NIES-54]